MNRTLATALLTPLLMCAAPYAAAQPRIDVQFVEPGGYTDVYPTGRRGTESELNGTLAALKKLIVEAGNKTLKPNDELKLDVLDVNLAGDFPPTQSLAHEIRVMRNVDWPSIKVRYTLKRDGKESTGEVVISDMSYLQGSQCSSAESFCYERRMMERWFRRDLK